MPAPLHILIIEDSVDDAALLVYEMQSAGFDLEWKRVETEAEFRASLNTPLHLIFSDFSLPQFSTRRALAVLQESKLDIPFIIVSGTIGEERAVEIVKSGVTDYVLKNRLERLVPAVRRALRETQERAERQRAEQQVRIQATALEAAANGILITDCEGTILSANSAFCSTAGYTLEEVVGKNPRFLKSGLHDAAFYRAMWDTIKAGRVWRGEVTNRRKDGTLYWEEMTITPVHATGGEITHFIGVRQDISERRAAEEALRASEERFRQLAENINEVFWITDPAQRQMIYISPAYEIIWGRTCASLYQTPQSWIDAIHPDDQPRVREAIRTKRMQGEYDEIYRILRPDGSLRWIRDRAFPIRNAAGEIYRVVGTAEDITQQHNLEEQFRQAQKMESIGQLAGGVAHDFNNILTVIQGHVYLLLSDPALTPPTEEAVDQISLAAEQAAGLTRQLLTFSRKQTMKRRLLDLNEVVGNMTKMLKRVLGEDISLEVSYASDLPMIDADPGMMEQIVMNLAVNARDAMPSGGQLLLRTARQSIDLDYVQSNAQATEGDYICLTVRDTGCGISPEVLPRIFEPFFTTKAVGKGTGLGLAMVYGIVQQHRGWITVESEVGTGTAFRTFLPVATPRENKESDQAAEGEARGGSETILLVEDEGAVRALVRNVLERYGYKVIEAVSGRSASRVWREHRGEIDLLLTDMIMPDGVTGRDLVDDLHSEKPSLPVIYTSGYSAEVVGKDCTLQDGLNFLQKPYSPHKLVRAVRDVLDQVKHGAGAVQHPPLLG
ncbi:MAG: PAS domain S-box protein [Verrucomicrobiales bacterium]|nr:PAS domain S-box protein [Verrucomicrobiales bacterium]